MRKRIFLLPPPTPLDRVFHHPDGLASCVTPLVITRSRWGRNINRLSIGYAFRLHLRSRLTLGGLTFPRNPWASGQQVSHLLFATHAGILTTAQSTAPHGTTSTRTVRSPTNRGYPRFRSFGAVLSLLHFRRKTTRPVSCYALFKGWLLLSQPPGCLSGLTSFPHLALLRGLSWRSGLFPSRPQSFSPMVSLPGIKYRHSRFGRVW